MEWKNRIIGSGDIDPEMALLNPDNWRIHPDHQKRVMVGALEEIGWIQQIVINKTNGRIIDGHLRVMLAKQEGVKTVPVVYVDLNDEEEKKALASLDSISALADVDFSKLGDLLEEMDIESESLDLMFSGMMGEVSDFDKLSVTTSGERKLGETGRSKVKAVLYIDEIGLFEKAIKATCLVNRGAALLEICANYLNEKRQHHASPQDFT